MAEDKKQKDEGFELVEVPIETGVFVKNNKTEEILDDKKVLVEILNKLDKMEKSVG